ncbi:MAG: SGNH/GDSL hydrolase family protein, partial [Ruminococcus sp.]|nr:SGNH/GDSL hydrolase family protein [Ruminococcus sp.]
IVTEQNGAVRRYLGDTEIDTGISGSDLNALKENFVTNIILKKDVITVTGTGTYVNTKYEFPAENGVEYTLRIEKVTGGTDTPTAFIRTLDENGAAVETVTAGGTTRNIKISLTASGAKTVVVCFNGSVFSDMKGELRTFTGVLFTAGAEPYIRLSDSVNILPHKDLETLKSSIFFDRGLYKIFKAVGVVGDSLSVGHSGDAIRNVPFSWTKYVERDAGASWRCFGQSGYTALDWINEWYGYNVAKMEGNKCQCYIIGLGVNDARTAALGSAEDITSDTTAEQTSFYGAYAKIIYLLKDINPNAKIICLTNPRSNTGGDVNGFNNAIKYISAEHFGKDDNVFLLDLTAYSDLFSNANGIIAKDHTAVGSHYSPIGYRAIANVMEYAVDQLMTENQERFADVYGIPYDGGDGTVNTYQ